MARPLSSETTDGGNCSKATSLKRTLLAKSRPICTMRARSRRWPSSSCSTTKLPPQLSSKNRPSRSSNPAEGKRLEPAEVERAIRRRT